MNDWAVTHASAVYFSTHLLSSSQLGTILLTSTVNVQDNARCHVAALLSSDVNNERLFTFAHPYNWNDILAILRKLYPEQKFMDDIPNLGRDLSKVSNGRAEELVRRFGRPGWTSLEESVADATISCDAAASWGQ